MIMDSEREHEWKKFYDYVFKIHDKWNKEMKEDADRIVQELQH